MGVDRDISIRVITNEETFADLLEKFVDDKWVSTNTTLEVTDVDDYDFISFKDSQVVREILIKREKAGLRNHINLFANEESIWLISHKLEGEYHGYKNHYELNFSLGYGKRIDKANRYTDFGFYLNDIIPKLINIGCYVCEVTCRDL